MPKKNKENEDPTSAIEPGCTRKAQGYNPDQDRRGIKREFDQHFQGQKLTQK